MSPYAEYWKKVVHDALIGYKDFEVTPINALLLSRLCTDFVEQMLDNGFRITDAYGGLVIGVEVGINNGVFVPYPIYRA